jgi:hypothetical protein
MSDDKIKQKKIQCWISQTTWEQIEALGYSSPTLAVTRAFEILLDPSKDTNRSFRES